MFRDISDVYLHDETQKNNNDMKSIYDKKAFSHNISCIIFAFWCGFQNQYDHAFYHEKNKTLCLVSKLINRLRKTARVT